MLLYTINLNCHCDFNLSLPPSLAPPFLPASSTILLTFLPLSCVFGQMLCRFYSASLSICTSFSDHPDNLSQPQLCGHCWLHNSWWSGMCVVGCSAAVLVTLHWVPTPRHESQQHSRTLSLGPRAVKISLGWKPLIWPVTAQNFPLFPWTNYKVFFFYLSNLCFVYLKCGITQSEGETERRTICWFPPQTAVTTKAGLGWSREPGASSVSPTWMQRAKHLDHPPLPS